MRDDLQAAMQRHPAGRARLAELVQDAQDEQSLRAANKELYDLDEWGIASPRRIDEWHHVVSTGPHGRWLDVVGPLLIGLTIFLVVWGFGLLGAVAGGWPA